MGSGGSSKHVSAPRQALGPEEQEGRALPRSPGRAAREARVCRDAAMRLRECLAAGTERGGAGREVVTTERVAGGGAFDTPAGTSPSPGFSKASHRGARAVSSAFLLALRDLSLRTRATAPADGKRSDPRLFTPQRLRLRLSERTSQTRAWWVKIYPSPTGKFVRALLRLLSRWLAGVSVWPAQSPGDTSTSPERKRGVPRVCRRVST